MPRNIQDLSGKVTIDTGAFSGIGLATANLLAREGVKVALLSLTFRTNNGNIKSEFGIFFTVTPGYFVSETGSSCPSPGSLLLLPAIVHPSGT